MRRETWCLCCLALLALPIAAAPGPPSLVYSTYLGGSDDDMAFAVAADPQGNTYVTGVTWSADFPVSGSLQPLRHADAFVTKLDPDGHPVWSTWLGGSSGELGYGIGVSPRGDVYVTGITYSDDFPRIATTLPLPAADPGWGNVFIACLDASGSFLRWSATVGGSLRDEVQGLAVDRSGSVYLTGGTSSPDFPVRAALKPALSDPADAFLMKLTRDGAFVYSTYLGGGSFDYGWDVAADAAGNAYVVGETSSADFPVVNAAQPSPGDQGDAFVARVSPSGSSLVWSTYLGGSYAESGRSIAVDPAGSAYVTGFTGSPDFPTRNPLKSTINLLVDFYPSDAFVTKLGRSGTLVYSTYLGGSHVDLGEGIAVDAQGRASVTGFTQSTDFPLRDAFQTECRPAFSDHYCDPDVFVARLTPAGDRLDWASYLGGSTGPYPLDWPMDIALDPRGEIFLAGWTLSTDFPAVNAIQSSYGGGLSDAFVAKIAPRRAPARGR
jgi:hypothetical protein